jgi:exodeoxyribonuclease VII small subunit
MIKKKRIPGHASDVAGVETGQVGPSFEEAIQRLEMIVADMERAELPLEDVLKKYEEGTRLVRFCSQKLEEAEKKIELLTKKADGSTTLKPFTGEEDAAETENDRRRDTRAARDEDEAKLL